MNTQPDNLEYAVSQSVDGLLTDADRRATGDALRGGEASRLAAEHEQVNALLRGHAPLPAIDFDAFARSISESLKAEDAYAPAPMKMWPVWRGRLALAATVALVAAAAWPFLPHRDPPAGLAPTGGEAIVTGPTLAPPTTAPQLTVRVGPSDTLVRRGLATGLTPDAAAPAKPKVVITSAEVPSDLRPY